MSLASIYSKGVLTRNCGLSINEIGKNIKEILDSKLKRELEGKCCKDGYIKKASPWQMDMARKFGRRLKINGIVAYEWHNRIYILKINDSICS